VRAPEQITPTPFGNIPARLAGISYKPGDGLDRIVESFADPHDFFRALTGAYDPTTGNAKYLEGMDATFDSLKNFGLIPVAAPFSIGALVMTSNTGVQDAILQR
jgi:hypothetical protein